MINGIPQAYYIHTDQLNTPRLITDQSNNPVWKWDSDPFGSTPANEDPNGTGHRFEFNQRFPGQYFDQETGLNYNWHRDYDSQTGRYIESDLIGLVGGSFSTYAYVDNNPISLIDPEGLMGRAPGKPGPRFPNGNYDPGFKPQDMVCTLPGAIGRAANSNSCVSSCCVVHDQCYARNGCNASSWFGNFQGSNMACQQCNAEVQRCISKAVTKGCPSCN